MSEKSTFETLAETQAALDEVNARVIRLSEKLYFERMERMNDDCRDPYFRNDTHSDASFFRDDDALYHRDAALFLLYFLAASFVGWIVVWGLVVIGERLAMTLWR